jgi:hypothetical protein
VNSRVTIVLTALLLLGGSLIYLLLREGPRDSGPRAAPASRDAAIAAPQGELERPLSASVPPAAAAPATRVAETLAAGAPATGPWTVRVLREGTPAPDVDVAWATLEALRALPNDGKGAARDFVERVRFAGAHGRTNAAGELVLAPLPEGSGIAAFDGDTVAYHAVRGAETSPIVLELVLDRTLLVKVVDGRGTPVPHVPVLLDLVDGRVNQHWNETTRADGLATFRRIGVNRPLGAATLGTVSIAGTLDPPVEVPFRLADWPEAPLVLVVPDRGSVVIELVDEQGRLRTDLERDVELVIEREQHGGAMLYNRPRERVTPEGGRARFPLVGLGLRLRASCDGRPRFAPVEATFAGPLRAGEELVQRLVVGAPETTLLFRVLDPRNQPLAQSQVEVEITMHTGRSSISTGGERLPTDAEGRVRMPLLDRWYAGSTLVLGLTHETGLAAEVDLSREFPPGEADLGDVAMKVPPVLVAGRLVDVDGKPVSYAQVKVETHAGNDPSATQWWPILWANSGEDGSFSFAEGTTASDLRLAVSSQDFIDPEPLPFARGARDLMIVLERGGALAGSILAPEGLSPTTFELRCGSQESWDNSGAIEADGTFVLRGLAPDSVDVSVCLVPGQARLKDIHGVAVVDGETTRDPRLQGIDCRDLLSALHVSVKSADGLPADGGWVRVLGSTGREAGFLIEQGKALVLGPREPLDLEINVPGHRIERRFDVRSDLEVALQAAFRVRLELAREVELPAEPTRLQVRLERLSGPEDMRPAESLDLFRGAERTGWWNRYFGNDTNSFDASREVFATVQEPGFYTVEFFLVTGSPGGAMTSSSLTTSSDTPPLELDESRADATLRVKPDAHSLAEALGR